MFGQPIRPNDGFWGGSNIWPGAAKCIEIRGIVKYFFWHINKPGLLGLLEYDNIFGHGDVWPANRVKVTVRM